MLISTRPANVCIRCAYRTRLLALQQRRLRSTHPDRDENSNGPILRYLDKDDGGHELRSGPPRGQFLPTDGLIRKHSGRPTRKYSGRGEVGRDDRRGGMGWGGREGENFREVLMARLNVIKDEVKDAPVLQQLAKDSKEEGNKQEGFGRIWSGFTTNLLNHEPRHRPFLNKPDGKDNVWEDLRNAYSTRSQRGLDDRIKYAFYGHVTGSRFTESDIRNQKTLADLRYPTEWYPATRLLHRTVHLHVGPTNSGKTYQALQRLEAAKSGVYAGPLRLLAHEVYSRMVAKGKPCSLVTGEERRAVDVGLKEDDDHTLSACTVEMVPLNKTIDVAVIDEIQMIGNPERGWAWTQALLGVKAKEVHLCGEARTVPLIKELCASVGDKLEIHRYERLSPLQMAETSLDGDMRKLRKGDCIVSFSVMGIHALRKQIEQSTGRKVATVYGSLPPETRAAQARLFNDPYNDYDFLVASDAVGMGLNLAIKRIIFETSSKFDGTQRRTLAIADIKQIAGRAGRFRTAAQASDTPASEQDLAAAKGEIAAGATFGKKYSDQDAPDNVGLVTTMERFDYPIVSAAMQSEPEPIMSAGLFPPASVLERFASYFPPGTPFSYILTRLHELSQMHKRFHLCGLRDQIWLADLIEPVEGLTVTDRNVICSSPAGKADEEMWRHLIPALARCIALQSGGDLYDIKEMPLEFLELEVSASRDYLRGLERLHKGVVNYLWLSYRMPGIFNTRKLAFHVKGLVEEKIEDVLSKFSFSETSRRKMAAKREKEILESMIVGGAEGAEGDVPSAHPSERYVGAQAETETQDQPVLDIEDEENKAEQKLAELAQNDPDTSKVEQTQELAPAPEEDATSGIAPDLEGQKILTSGGDHFSGEEELPFVEPDLPVSPEVDIKQSAPNVEDRGSGDIQDDNKVIEELTGHEEDVPQKSNEAAAGSG
ncbi:ATP-dependent RNA helicase suv3, mitochondrial [Fulvia fulva]|nr:ATP-dependent RNA helicase suv3, mitochondrial [Fulvia fulva]